MPFSILFRNARILASALFFAVVALPLSAVGQSSVSSGTIQGTVTDATKAVVPNVKVEVTNPVSGLSRAVKTDGAGHFVVPNVPFNPYHLVISGPGFATYSQDVDVRSIVPVYSTERWPKSRMRSANMRPVTPSMGCSDAA